jgi:SAM-dependent methyltransferase
LDFGCGVGRLSQALGARFDAVVGVDVAPSMIDLADRYNQMPEKVSYRLNDRPDLSMFASGSFDLVFSSITLQHMEPALSRQYIAEFVRVLSPSGVAIFDLPVPTRRQQIKSAAPPAVRRIYQAVTSWPRPRMEMYGLDPIEVTRVIETAGGIVRHDEASYAGVQEGRVYVATGL